MLRKSRSEILEDFKAQVAQGKILVGVGAGTGITAKCSEKADVDMLAGMGIKVFSNLGDYPEWWAQLGPMGVTGFKTNYPDAYTEWWQSQQ